MVRQPFVIGDCVICEDHSYGYHFGVVACRACAAFFRRTIALQLHYRCRSNGACQIHKSVRCLCRECRYKKCLTVGMQVEAVQLNRDAIGRMNERRNTRQPSIAQAANSTGRRIRASSNGGAEHSSLQVTSTTSPAYEHHHQPSSNSSTSTLNSSVAHLCDLAMDIPTHSPLYQQIMQIFRQAGTDLKMQQRPSLTQMLTGYRNLLDRRAYVHRNVHFDLEAKERSPDEETARVFANGEAFAAMIEGELELIAQMVTVFHPFLQLPDDQKWVLFKHFWMQFCKAERAYEMFHRFGGENTEKHLLQNGTICDVDVFNYDLLNFARMKREQVESIFALTHDLMGRSVVAPIQSLNPSALEFMAMCTQLLWNTAGLKGITKSTDITAAATRSAIFNELHELYVNEMRISNYSSRLAELMLIVSSVEKLIAQKKEDMIVVNVFGVDRRKNQVLAEIFDAK